MSTAPSQLLSSPTSQKKNSKKYSKVNEEIKQEFLSLITNYNKSIKEVIKDLFRLQNVSTSTTAVLRPSFPTIEKDFRNPGPLVRVVLEPLSKQ